MEETNIRLKFEFNNAEPTTADLFELSDLINSISQALIRDELKSISHYLEIPNPYHFLSPILKLRKKELPHLVEIKDLHKGSLIVEAVLLGGPFLYWVSRNFLTPVLQQAFNESRLKRCMRDFARDKMFGGADKTIEKTASDRKWKRGIEISEVREEKHTDGLGRTFRIKTTRKVIVPPDAYMKEDLRKFLKQLHED